MNRRLLMVISVATLICMSGAAWAIPPVRGSASFNFNGCDAGDPIVLYDCGGGIMVCEVALADLDWKLFFDREGNPIRYWERNKLIGGIAEVGNTDNFLPYNPLSYTIKVDILGEKEIITGVWALVTVPGYGQIFKDVGRIVFDVDRNITYFEAGEHEYFNEEFDAVCEYLANN